jgi:hypothetical protein
LERRATYREVFAVGEFRALFVAYLLSVIGDQFARVALSVLVFDRTGSASLTALTYALTFLPAVVGGPLLSGIADQYPRRAVMIVADLVRAGLVVLMAMPGLPLVGMWVLLLIVQLAASPFDAARAATLRAVFVHDRDQYVVSSSLSNVLYQFGQLLGFVSGGFLVAAVTPSGALLIDAATFLLSAGILRRGVVARPRPGREVGGGELRKAETEVAVLEPWGERIKTAALLLWTDRQLRMLTALMAVTAFVVPIEGLAVPYAADLGLGAVAVGLLLAADPAGSAAGMLVLNRVPPEWRLRLMRPLAVASPAVLIGCAMQPGLAVTVVLWMLSGVCSAYSAVANALLVHRLPDGRAGQAFGLMVTAVRASQGLAVLLAGAAADLVPPAVVIASAGALGAGVAWSAASGWLRSSDAASR